MSFVQFALTDTERAHMLASRPIESVEVREYRPGENVVHEGEPCRYFYAILQGEVQISQLDKPIRILTDRDVFGLENYYRGIPYTTTAKATKTSRIATYEADLIDEIAYSKPALATMVQAGAGHHGYEVGLPPA